MVYENSFRLTSAIDAQPHSLLVNSSRQGPVESFLSVPLLIFYFLPLKGGESLWWGRAGGRVGSGENFTVKFSVEAV